MEYRSFGATGLRVPILSFGTATFGGATEFFKTWGATREKEAARLVDLCLDLGANLFDTANSYSNGMAEEILGRVLAGRRDRVLLSTKASTPLGDAPNEGGSSRGHLLKACEASLRRLRTDHIDIYYMHEFDATTPVEETLATLDGLVKSGKVRYIACSNFSGWHLAKSLAVSERYGWARYGGHQVSYSLAQRDYEWELMPLALDQRVTAMVWSPLAGGALSGKISRTKCAPTESRVAKANTLPADRSRLYAIIDTLENIAAEIGKPVAQVAVNWLLQRPSVSSVIFGARTEAQLQENLGAATWTLEPAHVERLDRVSETAAPYPYSHQYQVPKINPPPVRYYCDEWS